LIIYGLILGFQIDDIYRSTDGYPGNESGAQRLHPHCSFGPAEVLFASFRTEGRVTTACLWHACRVVTLGCLLVIMGITMVILGKLFLTKMFRKSLFFYANEIAFFGVTFHVDCICHLQTHDLIFDFTDTHHSKMRWNHSESQFHLRNASFWSCLRQLGFLFYLHNIIEVCLDPPAE